jgi:hypothetical protein
MTATAPPLIATVAMGTDSVLQVNHVTLKQSLEVHALNKPAQQGATRHLTSVVCRRRHCSP